MAGNLIVSSMDSQIALMVVWYCIVVPFILVDCINVFIIQRGRGTSGVEAIMWLFSCIESTKFMPNCPPPILPHVPHVVIVNAVMGDIFYFRLGIFTI